MYVEVEGSAAVRSNRELVRASCEIQRATRGAAPGEFSITETKVFDKPGEPLASRDWPGTYVWRVSAEQPALEDNSRAA